MNEYEFKEGGVECDMTVSDDLSIADIQITVDLDYILPRLGSLSPEQAEVFRKRLWSLLPTIEGTIKEKVAKIYREIAED